MKQRGLLVIRRTRWVVLAGMAVAVTVYVIVSVLGYSSVASGVAQGTFWLLLLYFLVAVLCATVPRRRRSAARAGDAELSALLLGKRSPTMLDQPVDQYSAYPPEESDVAARRPGKNTGEQ